MNAERASSLFWLAVGLISLYGSFRLGLGTLHEPGSGFLPFLAGCFICGMAIIVFLQSFIRGKGVQGKISAVWSGVNWHRSLIIVLAILGFILVLEKLGFFLTGFLLMFLLFKGVERLSWAKAIFIPGLVLGLTYLVFDVFLKATLPRGFLGF